MQYISEEYRGLNQQLHSTNKAYGASSVRHAALIMNMVKTLKTNDVLDYGCGKSALARNLPFNIKEYDPAIKELSDLPSPADIVVCTDVLEHVEPELIDNVLHHLAKLTKKAGFFTVATRPAKKRLADGRNAHLIVESADWWTNKFEKLFKIMRVLKEDEEHEFFIFVEPKGEKGNDDRAEANLSTKSEKV